MFEISQDKIIKLRNAHKEKFSIARQSSEFSDNPKIYYYNSLALQDRHSKFIRADQYSIEYEPNPFIFQYDLEFYIFLNYERIKAEELEHSSEKDKSQILEFGPTGFSREEHLLNAMAIRWPIKVLSTGAHSGILVRTPWLEDFATAMANYSDVITYGGGGQGKTYGFLAFQCMLFDHFIKTKSGAQCSYSTVNEVKLKGSTWAYVNKLYPTDPKRRFSLYAGFGKKAPEYTFKRVDDNGKEIMEGGKFQGVLLSKGIKDTRVIDKLTGCHDPIARAYLLDEGQATDGAPLSAYTNMFLHPKYGWFGMSGNFDSDTDLLGMNVEPNIGWTNIDESTHIYEGTLKSPDSNLGRITSVIHYNNELSPAMTDLEMARKFPFMPNREKKDKLYKTEESRNSYGYKRFWIGFRFEKENVHEEYVLTSNIIKSSNCHQNYNVDVENGLYSGPIFTLGSFDSAPASKDRNLMLVADVGLDSHTRYPIVNLRKLLGIKKSETYLTYYTETCDQFEQICNSYNIASGQTVMDWSAKPALIELLGKRNHVCHFIIYHGLVPSKPGINKVDGSEEDAIDLETLKTFLSNKETEVTYYAHQKMRNCQTLGAYAMRMFVEKGRVRGLNPSLLNGVDNHGFDKEICKRKFVFDSKGLANLDDKDEFIKQYHFSTDIFDVLMQLFYMIYVKHKIRPDVKSLGLLTKPKGSNRNIKKLKSLWDLKIRRF